MAEIHEPEDRVPLIDGNKGDYSKVIGYCNSPEHPGYLTQNLLKNHDCVKRECELLEKHNLHYWKRIERERREAKERRELAKRLKKESAERETFIKSVFKEYRNIYITSIKKTDNLITISYIYNGYADLSRAAYYVKKKYGCSVYLNAVETDSEIKRLLGVGQPPARPVKVQFPTEYYPPTAKLDDTPSVLQSDVIETVEEIEVVKEVENVAEIEDVELHENSTPTDTGQSHKRTLWQQIVDKIRSVFGG